LIDYRDSIAGTLEPLLLLDCGSTQKAKAGEEEQDRNRREKPEGRREVAGNPREVWAAERARWGFQADCALLRDPDGKAKRLKANRHEHTLGGAAAD
jgi:hypothetical protein